jgi:TolA-binding protein
LSDRENALLQKRITRLNGTLEQQQQQHERQVKQLQEEYEAALQSLTTKAAEADQAWVSKLEHRKQRPCAPTHEPQEHRGDGSFQPLF